MASPGANVVTGQVTGTGALITIQTVGFTPKAIWLNAGGASGFYQKSMAAASVYKRTAAGVGSLAAVNGITLLATHDGFSIGTDADLNVNGTVIDYTVIAE